MPLDVEFIELERFPEQDIPAQNLWGVLIYIYLFGDPGRVKITWGNYMAEIYDVDRHLSFGGNKIANSLPPGTHNICVDVI